MLATYLGDRLGWYKALAAGGPASADELVARAAGSARYAREWLEHQAVTGVLTVESDGRFRLPEGAAEVLTDPTSLSYLAPLARMFAAAGARLPLLLDAYRFDGGVAWADYGVDMRESQADMNRPWFEQRLPDALMTLPEIDAVLGRRDALIADIGCGAGWSTIALARAYPLARLEGWDVDRPSIGLARDNGLAAGLEDQVVFCSTDASHLADQSYDAIFAFECIHDMFGPNGDDLEKLMYGFSLLVCLPDAREAGFTGVEVLPTGEFGLWRFYRLTT